MGKKPGRTLALRWYEDALALASYVEAQGFSEGERLGQALSAGHAALEDWSYLPPIADDWEEWRGVAKWCALDQRYRFHIEMTIFLRQGEGPFFCPICEESPSEDHESIVCLECAWETVLYNRAIDAARELGRAWSRTREVAA